MDTLANNNNNGSSTTNTALVVPGETPDFAAMLKERSRQRKDREDAAIAGLRVQVQRLEAALKAETNRRVAVTQHLKETAKGEWDRIENVLKQQYRDLADESEGRWSSLEDRLSFLEEKWKQDVLGAEHKIAETTKTLEARLEEIEAQSQHDKQSRQELYDGLTQQMNEITESFDGKWKEEGEARAKAVDEIREKWEASHKDTSQRDITTRLEKEVEQLRAALVQEKMERQQHDEGLLQNLQVHSNELQQSVAGLL